MIRLTERHKEQMVALLRQYLRIPSRSTPEGGEEGPLQALVAEQMRRWLEE